MWIIVGEVEINSINNLLIERIEINLQSRTHSQKKYIQLYIRSTPKLKDKLKRRTRYLWEKETSVSTSVQFPKKFTCHCLAIRVKLWGPAKLTVLQVLNDIPWQRFVLLSSLYLLLCAAYRTRFATSTISTLFDDQHSSRWSPRADRPIGRLVHMIRRMSNHLISTDRSAYNMWGADRCRCHMSKRDHPFLFLTPHFPSKKEKLVFLWPLDPALVYCSRFSLSLSSSLSLQHSSSPSRVERDTILPLS